MKIVFFTHPDFLAHQSMPRFTTMLVNGMKKRGHITEVWSPKAKFSKFSKQKTLSKWLGYIDQFVVFPRQVKKQLLREEDNTIYVFIDQALGPWVPLVSYEPHVIHCHDFLAQYSAQGKIIQNSTSITGKLYQNFIRRGYLTAKNFIPVSQKTKDDLIHFLKDNPSLIEVVYNGLNQAFAPSDINQSRKYLTDVTKISLKDGFILHVGGNQWYKNRLGVLDIYIAWRKASALKIPLLLIGEKASVELEQKKRISVYADDIFILDGLSDESVKIAYCGASVLVFPSIAEGFGWPIAEAMASGCPVITTNVAPMTEVAGDAGIFIPLMPDTADELIDWATESAKKIEYVLNLSLTEREALIKAGIENAKRFDTEIALDKIEKIYEKILSTKII